MCVLHWWRGFEHGVSGSMFEPKLQSKVPDKSAEKEFAD